MAGTPTFTSPPGTSTISAASLVAGGNLSVGTTYHAVVVAMGTNGRIDISDSYSFGGISNEESATPTLGNQTMRITFSSVTGALAYCIFLATSSDGYWGSNGRTYSRLSRISDNSGYYPSLPADPEPQPATYTVDIDGSITLKWPYVFSVVPASFAFPGGLDPRTNGYGKLEFTGGTHVAPVDCDELYTWMVANGHGAHVYFDGLLFALCAYLKLSGSTETHFIDTNKSIFLIGHCYLGNTHADSEFRLGERSSGGLGSSGGSFTHWKSLSQSALECASGMAEFYDLVYQGPFGYLDGSSVYPNGRLEANSSSLMLDKVTLVNAELVVGAYAGLSRIIQPDFGFENSGKNLTTYERVVGDGYIRTSGAAEPIRRATFFTTSFALQLLGTSDSFVLHGVRHYGGCTETDGSITISWPATATDSYVDACEAFLARVVDSEGSPQSGASITILDDDDAAATDYDGTLIGSLTTDSLGYLWREALTSTAVDADTLTVSGAGWSVDEWQGREIMFVEGVCAGERVMIKSNTSDTLTFVRALPDTPSAGDKAGILIDLKRYRATHKGGSGGGSGLSHTDVAWKEYSISCEVEGEGEWADTYSLQPVDVNILEIALQQPGMSKDDVLDIVEGAERVTYQGKVRAFEKARTQGAFSSLADDGLIYQVLRIWERIRSCGKVRAVELWMRANGWI